ncbi:MAG: hypothetical protein EZS28_043274, partial [Streblomastix strix]
MKTQSFLWVLDYPNCFSGLHCLLEYSDLSNGQDRTKLKYFRQILSMDLNKVTPRHEKEHDVVGTRKKPASDEQHEEQTINAVPPWMRILMGRPPNSPQAIALQQQLDANTIMYETY